MYFFLSITISAAIFLEIVVIASAMNFELITGKNSSIVHFNNLYATSFNEKNLRADGKCYGECTGISHEQFDYYNREGNPNCFGNLHACWPVFNEIEVDCQLCACLCERTFNPTHETIRGELLDSFCFDPVSVHPGHVATGVRFKKHNNRIHVELQQGKLKNGRIIEESISWKSIDGCKKSKKVISHFNGWKYSGLKIGLEDFILPKKAVVTGISFGKSLQGKYLDLDGNINGKLPGTKQFTHYKNSVSDVIHSIDFDGEIWTSSVLTENEVFFKGSSYMEDYMQHVLPAIDLREVVTNPPGPIRGIGLYLQRDPVFEEVLSLRIF